MNKVIEGMAERMAIALNGGTWATHYTERQKDVWRRRARMILEREI